jgi:hypothetical protein
MPPLGPAAADPVRAGHLLPPRLAGRPQVQVSLQQQPRNLPAPHPELFLEHRVIQASRLPAGQPPLDLRVFLPRPREHHLLRVLWHRAPPDRSRSSNNQERNRTAPPSHPPARTTSALPPKETHPLVICARCSTVVGTVNCPADTGGSGYRRVQHKTIGVRDRSQ